ncbi:hypothetical protein BM607_019445 [Shewanella sp. SACH]|uniref:hypothetical protein n=1 Tax=Shewanella sp. SACH TaxID=1873135 RepID=UPI0009044122|nr:hypothetical protein [Shewanella sp. SACH]OUS50166.1 hypothetical protein BM607_019445 [Shewanella sp. SACH]
MNLGRYTESARQHLRQVTKPLPSKLQLGLSKLWRYLSQGFAKLSFAQKLYLIALILAFSTDLMGVVAVIAVIAMAIEFWPVFERVWHSLAGKAVLLLFYAIIANFALGWSGAIVNEVVGVSASHLDYTHNLAILLYMPAWFLMVSAIVLLALQLIIPIYLVLIFLLKPLGVKSLRITSHTSFRKTTFTIRIVLAAVVLYHLSLLIDLETRLQTSFADFITTTQEASEHNPVEPALGLMPHTTDVLTAPIAELAKIKPELEADKPADKQTADEREEAERKQTYASVRAQYQYLVRQWLATFAFALEANSRSRCEKPAESNVIELNDYEILQITPDKKADYGYRFEVKKCISAAFPLTEKGK